MFNSEKQLERVVELAWQGELECCSILRKNFVYELRGEVLVQLTGQRTAFREERLF